MKRCISILLMIVVVLTMFPSMVCIQAAGNEDMEAYVENIDELSNSEDSKLQVRLGNISGKPGSKVSVPLYIKNIPGEGIYTCRFWVNFDSKKIKIDKVSSGELIADSNDFISYTNNQNGFSAMAFMCPSDGKSLIKEDGVFATIDFIIPNDGAEDAQYSININTAQCDIYSMDYNEISEVVFKNGKISVNDGEEKIQVALDNIKGEPGSKILVPITIDNIQNGSIYALSFWVDFDPEILKVEKVFGGDLIEDSNELITNINNNTGFVAMAFLGPQDQKRMIDDNGVFATIEFVIEQNANIGSVCDINFNVEKSDAFKADYQAITNIQYKNGKVKVEKEKNEFTIEVGSASGAPGSKVTVPVKIKNIPGNGIYTSRFWINYDAGLTAGNVLFGELVKESNDIISNIDNTRNFVAIAFLSPGDQSRVIKEDGVFATVDFVIPDNAVSGTSYSLSFNTLQCDVFAQDYEELKGAQFVDGIIKVN